MLFVNSVANIVHLHCTSTHGHPNKNVGDAFLLVWKKHDLVQEEEGVLEDDAVENKKGQQDTAAKGEGAIPTDGKHIEEKEVKGTEEKRKVWGDIAEGAMKCIMRIINEMKSLNAAVAQEKLAGHDGGKVWWVVHAFKRHCRNEIIVRTVKVGCWLN